MSWINTGQRGQLWDLEEGFLIPNDYSKGPGAFQTTPKLHQDKKMFLRKCFVENRVIYSNWSAKKNWSDFWLRRNDE